MRTKSLLFILLGVFSLILCTSCKKTKKLSEYRREERESIQNFIKGNSIEVLNDFPTDTVFGEKQFFLDSTGVYIHVIKKGEGALPVKGDEIIFPYIKYSLSCSESIDGSSLLVGDVISDQYSPETYGDDVPKFIYNVDYKVAAFNTAMKYLKHNAEAYLIVPSAVGFSSDQTSFTAYFYKVRVKIKG